MLTHYPDVNDSFSWLDGAVILLFIAGATVAVGGAVFAGLWAADRVLPRTHGLRNSATGQALGGRLVGVHKLAQGLIPTAGIGVFLGLTATTLTLLQHEGVSTGWANAVRFALLGLALAWSLRFEWRLTGLRSAAPLRRLSAVGLIALGLVPFCWAWELFFVRW